MTRSDFEPESLILETNGIRLRCLVAGKGPTVVLLHGFPEFSYSWRFQLPSLVEAGFRVIAPDLRGYNESSRPAGIVAYRTNELVADIVGLILELVAQPSFLVGHDWGGLVAWRVAALYPQLFRGLAIINAPHPAAFRRLLLRDSTQWLRSSYTAFFQVPRLPEVVLSRKNFAMLERMWRRHATSSAAFTEADLATYKEALAKSGLAGPLNYYRAVRRHPGDLFGAPQTVTLKTLVIWGDQDPFLKTSVLNGIEQWVPSVMIEHVPDASHWPQLERPGHVNTLLIEFFRSS